MGLDILLECMDAAVREEFMMTAKENFINTRHGRAITQISSGKKSGYWKTYIYIAGKRKEVLRKEKSAVIEFLYEFYTRGQKRTLEQVFAEYCEDETRLNGRSGKTVYEKKTKFSYLGKLRGAYVEDITQDDIKEALNAFFQEWAENHKGKPKKDFVKRLLQLLNALFFYSIEHGYCTVNPAATIRARSYYHRCDTDKKQDEQRAFSEEELQAIRQDILTGRKTGAACAQLLSMCTAMRMGELLALKKEDIQDGYIHVHRQLVADHVDGVKKIVVREYTKNERQNPRGGRLIPITPEAQEAIDFALSLPGESEFLFHDKAGQPVKQNAYINNLKRRCRRVEAGATHNHAFRVAFNSELNRMGLSPSDRALVLGHTVETNERFYSVTDKRRIDIIAEKMRQR